MDRRRPSAAWIGQGGELGVRGWLTVAATSRIAGRAYSTDPDQDVLSCDPELDLIFYGTGNPGPWNPGQRPSDNKCTCGIFASDPDTGAARWFYQTIPHDAHDYDGINELILLDMPVDGADRKVVVRPERNGYIYVLDRRATGEVLSADPFFEHINTSKGVDLKTGRLIERSEEMPRPGRRCAVWVDAQSLETFGVP